MHLFSYWVLNLCLASMDFLNDTSRLPSGKNKAWTYAHRPELLPCLPGLLSCCSRRQDRTAGSPHGATPPGREAT